jgi:hypothetical protein
VTIPKQTYEELEAMKAAKAHLEKELHAQKAVAHSLQLALQNQLKAPPGLQLPETIPEPALEIEIKEDPVEPMESDSSAVDDCKPISEVKIDETDESVSEQGDFKPVTYKNKKKSGDEGESKPIIYKKKPIPKHLK